MKNLLLTLVVFSLIISCNKNNDVAKNDFYKTEYRIGLWITSDKKDTLEFIDGSTVTRRGFYHSNEKYLYRINGNNLYLKLPNSEYETQHPILAIYEKSVKLGNMYITTGMGDNSGTFYKIIQ